MANGIYDLIQQGAETAKRYAQLGTPVLNFAKGLTVGPSEAYISDTMRDQLVQKAKETELDKGTLGYEDFGLPVTTEGGRFTGGLFDLAANDPVAFGNVGSVGRVSFEKDPTQPGGYKFGSTEFNFTPDKDTGSTGSATLDFINKGGFQSTPLGQAIYDLGGKIADLNFGFTSAAAAEPPSSQKYSQQFSVTRPSQFDTRQVPQVPGTDVMRDSIVEDVVDTPTREFGDMRVGRPDQGIYGSPAVQDLPVDFSELDDLDADAENEEIQNLIEQAQREERRGALETLKAFGKDVAGRTILSNILQGAGTVIGGPVVGTVAGITGLLKGGNIFEPTESQRAFNTLTSQGKAAVRDIYGPGGIMQNYNPISLFGRGPISAIDRRLSKMSGRTAASQQKMRDLFDARDKIMQTTLDDDARNLDKITSSVRGQRKGVMDDDPFAIGTSKTTDSDPGGSSKIVCTMMNESYGFGDFRNKIWLRQSKDLAPEYQKGYHILFLPLVKIAKTNKIVKKVLEHIAVHRTIDIRQESRGKTHMLGRLYRKVLEPICYWVGKYAKR